MATKLATHIKVARRRVYASLPRESRAAHALTRILGTGRPRTARRVKAYSKGMITKIIEDELRKEGVRDELAVFGEDLPNLEWGRYYLTVLNTYTRNFNLTQDQREDVLAELVADTVMGTTLLPDRGRSTMWKHNVIGYLQEWAEEGKSENEIKALLTKFLKNKATNIIKRYLSVHVKTDDSFESGRPSDDWDGGGMYEDLFTLDGLAKGQMSSYMSLLRQNSEVKSLVQSIDRWLARKDDEYAIIWKAYMADPTASMAQLLDNKVRVNGQTVPLWEALGFEEGSSSNVGKFGYRVKKLREMLERKWPEIEETLATL